MNLAGPKQTARGGGTRATGRVDTEHFGEEVPPASDVLLDVLSEKVRKAFHDEKVVRVIFTTFVMQ